MRERVLPWLLVLPALLFAAPFSPLADDPFPHLAGTGLALVLLVPAALLLLTGRARLGHGWAFVAALAWAACVAGPCAAVSDPLEARRALLGLASAPLCFAGAATLERGGRARLSLALVLLSGAWTLQALLAGLRSGAWAGLLGDSGSLSQAALPGAAIGAAWLVQGSGTAGERGARRFLGATVLVLFALHVAAAPVLAGAHSLLAALLCATWLVRGRGRGGFAALALGALLAPFVGLAAKELVNGKPPASLEGAADQPAHSLGGLGVRALVWRASLGLLAAHPLVGAGPGQFQAAFPPYRDAHEIELSRHGLCSELDTEVEHAHNDWLQAFLELGLPGGLCIVLGLAASARAAARALAHEERLPLALAALAVLVNAFVHAPLSANPASAPLAFALLGSLASGGTPSRRTALLAALPVLLALPFAPALITHGAILSDYARTAGRIAALAAQPADGRRDAELAAESARARAVLLAAQASEPDSAPLLALAARLAEGEERASTWEHLLRIRPHSVEAWEQSATDQARLGHAAEAQHRYHRALELSPTHARILRNLARLELTQGDLELGLETLARLRAQGCLAPDFASALGVELVLALGRPERGARVLCGAGLAHLAGEALHAQARAPENTAIAAALECLAQLVWAREHAQGGAFELALRNYRQAHERSLAGRAQAAPLYALELAAAEERAGQREKAREHARGVARERSTWDELPSWARDALVELGLEGPR